MSYSPIISIGLNLYLRFNHTIEVICNGSHFLIVRNDKQWHIRLANNSVHVLGKFGSDNFWKDLDSVVYSLMTIKKSKDE